MMTETVTRTFDYAVRALMSKLDPGIGPRWKVPDRYASPPAPGLPGPGQRFQSEASSPPAASYRGNDISPGLKQFFAEILEGEQVELDFARTSMAAVERKLKEPGLKAGQVADLMARVATVVIMGYPPELTEFAKVHAIQLAARGSRLEKKMGAIIDLRFK